MVSAVAQDKSNDGDQNHGAVVSAAAHDKSCGTDDGTEAEDATDEQNAQKDGKKAGQQKPGASNNGLHLGRDRD
jgi:hypothetical protein